jgi:hypothetical protein
MMNPDSFGQTVENIFHLSFLRASAVSAVPSPCVPHPVRTVREGKACIDTECDDGPMLSTRRGPRDRRPRDVTRVRSAGAVEPPTREQLDAATQAGQDIAKRQVILELTEDIWRVRSRGPPPRSCPSGRTGSYRALRHHRERDTDARGSAGRSAGAPCPATSKSRIDGTMQGRW